MEISTLIKFAFKFQMQVNYAQIFLFDFLGTIPVLQTRNLLCNIFAINKVSA